jgi:hypothetical protein
MELLLGFSLTAFVVVVTIDVVQHRRAYTGRNLLTRR